MLKKGRVEALILIVILASTAFHSVTVIKGEAQDIAFTIRMTVTYSNPRNGTRTWNFTEEDRTISLFMNNAWQIVQLISHSQPLEVMKKDGDENPVAVLSFSRSEIKPGENMSYTAVYHVVSRPRSIPNIMENVSETLEEIPRELREKYCGGEGPWLVNDPELRELAHNIAKNETKVLTIIKKFVSWIKENVKYPREMHEVPLYPNETYTKREGDCDDQAVLLITLCRIYGIPSHLQIGCIHMPKRLMVNETYWGGHVTSILKQIGWHGWATVYIPPWGWLPVDLTYVMGDLSDPLNAIRKGAVTLQETIQYMNVTRTDYVASSRTSREFLTKNDFYVHMEDEMFQDIPQRSLWEEIIHRWLQWILIAMVIVTLASVALLHIQKIDERRSREG